MTSESCHFPVDRWTALFKTEYIRIANYFNTLMPDTSDVRTVSQFQTALLSAESHDIYLTSVGNQYIAKENQKYISNKYVPQWGKQTHTGTNLAVLIRTLIDTIAFKKCCVCPSTVRVYTKHNFANTEARWLVPWKQESCQTEKPTQTLSLKETDTAG